jgi:tricorn protease
MKKITTLFAAALFLFTAISAFGREARLVRYPHYHNGRIVFSYLGDIWTADENGSNIQRLTVNRARDVYGRFSPDGKWIAFSSERNGNLDVFLMPANGGNAKQLTSHSADDVVLGWSADSRSILFSSNRGEDFMPQLYLVSTEGACHGAPEPTWASRLLIRPTGKNSLTTRRDKSTGRKYYRGAYNTDIMIMGRRGEEVYADHGFRRSRFMAHVGTRRLYLLRQRSRRRRSHEHLPRFRNRRQSRSRDDV